MNLSTERIVLRPWTSDDAEALFALASDSEVAEWAGFPAHNDIEESRRVIREVLSAPECYAIVLREADNVVGCIQTFVPRGDRYAQTVYDAGSVEVGFWLGRKYWGRGIMPEALSLLYRWQYQSGKFKWAYMFGRTNANNESARIVFEKSGFSEIRGVVTKKSGECRYQRFDIFSSTCDLDYYADEIGRGSFRFEEGEDMTTSVCEGSESLHPDLELRLVDGSVESDVVHCGGMQYYIPDGLKVGDVGTGYLFLEARECKKLEDSEATYLCSKSSDVSVVRIHKCEGRLYGTIDGFPHVIPIIHPYPYDYERPTFETIATLHSLQEGDLVKFHGEIGFAEV